MIFKIPAILISKDDNNNLFSQQVHEFYNKIKINHKNEVNLKTIDEN